MGRTPELRSRIFLVRGQRIMLDSDLALAYGVPTKVLNQAVRRNFERFPPDFMFQLTQSEAESLRSRIVTSNLGRGGRRYQPFAFTEHGAVMLSAVLRSATAIQASLRIARAFVHLRRMISTHKELGRRLEDLERRVVGHGRQIGDLFEAIDKMIDEPPGEPRTIGFRP